MSRKTRKLIWSVPFVAVLAVAGVLAVFVALEPGSVFANPLPAAPMNLEVEAASGAAGRTTLVLDWDAPAGGNVSGYRIDMANRGAVWETLTMDTGSTATTYTDSTLTAEDTRWYRVFAVNSHEAGPVSNAVSGTTDEKVNPGSVMNLRAVPNAKNSYNHIDLSWDPPAANGGEKIVGYEIQYHDDIWKSLVSTPTGGYVTRTIKTSRTDVSGAAAGTPLLDPGDSRLYRVRAINGPAEVTALPDTPMEPEGSVSKDWVRVTGTTKAASIPGQVTGLTAVNATATSINLYWYDPEDNGGWIIDGYLVQARREGKKFPSILPKNEDLTSFTGTVTLGGTDGDTNNMDTANRYVDRKDSPDVLQASFADIEPRNDTEDANGPDNLLQVRWYFRVFAVTVDDGPDDDAAEVEDNVNRRSKSASNEANAVAAVREMEYDHDNAPETAVKTADPLAAPTIDPTGTNIGDTDHLKQEIRLKLTVARAVTDAALEQIAYRIDYSKDGIAWKLLERATLFTEFGEDRPYDDDKDLGFDETRRYRVFAFGKDPYKDVGPSSIISTGSTKASTVPDKPTGLMVSAPALDTIQASWTAPRDNGGQDIVSYLVQWVVDDEDEVAEADDFGDIADVEGEMTDDASTMALFELMTDDELEGDTDYVFRVAAVNKLGADERPGSAIALAPFAPKWSDPVLFSTTEAAKPNAVEGLTSEAASDTSGNVTGVNLLWNRPSDEITITRYEIEVQDDEGDWVNPAGGENSRMSRTSYTDPDEPEADEVRKYQVRAVNEVGDGEGPWTMVYYPREPEADHSHAAVGVMAPSMVEATDGTGTVTVTWVDSENAVGHLIMLFKADFSSYVHEAAPVGNSHTFMAVAAGDYVAVVVAYDAANKYKFGVDAVTVN